MEENTNLLNLEEMKSLLGEEFELSEEESENTEIKNFLREDYNKQNKEELISKIHDLEKLSGDTLSSFEKLLDLLNQLSDALAREYEEDQIVSMIFRLSRNIVPYVRAGFLQYEGIEDKYNIRELTEESESFRNLLHRFNEEGIYHWAASKKQPVMVPDIPMEDEEIETQNVSTYLLLPLSERNRILGMVCLELREGIDDYSRHNSNLLYILGTQTATAISNARMFEEMDDKNQILHENQVFMDCVHSSMSSGIIAVNLLGEITLITSKAIEFLEPTYTSGTPHFANVFPPKLVVRLEKLIAEGLLSGNSSDGDIENIYRNSEEIPLGFTASSLMDKNQENMGLIILCTDLSETQELENLRKLDKMKNELISNVSHELRTPLTSIKAYTETLLMTLDDGDKEMQEQFLGVIEHETDRLTNLIKNLLDMSTLESGFRLLNISEFNLTEEVKKCCMVIDKLALQKGIKVIREISSEPVMIQADKDRISQVVMNFLSNAIKYNRDDGNITVKFEDDGENIKIVIQDSGMGIPEKDIPHVFDKFFRVDSSLKYEISGTGIGLSICKLIIEQHQGEVGVESEIEKGSSFWFTLKKKFQG